MHPNDIREKAVAALMALAAETNFDRIGLRDVADRAGIGLADLRGAFDDTLDILAEFTRATDRAVLAGTGEDMDDEPARERLFDVLMRRFDHLQAHKGALRSVTRALSRDPLALARWNRTALVSAAWMLTAARIDTSGLLGRLRAQGLVLAWSRAFRVFLKDDDAGMARTMAELDSRLRAGERWLGTLSRLAPRCAGGRRRREPETAGAEPG